MIDKQFDKETFKKSVKDNVKFLYRRKLEEATQEQLFQAVHFAPKPPRNITNEQSPYWLLFTPCPVTRFAEHYQ